MNKKQESIYGLAKGVLVFIMLACVPDRALSQKATGMSHDSGRFYYMIQREVYCRDLTSSKLIWQKNLGVDTQVVNSLVATMKKALNLKGDTAIMNAKAAITDYNTMNITCCNGKIYIGIKYHTVKHVGQRTWFALLEFTTSLKLIEHYVFLMKPPFRYFSLPPYHSLHFVSENTLLIPLYVEGKMQLYSFTLHKKNHKAFPTTSVLPEIRIVKKAVIHVGEYIYSEPMLYTVSNSGFQYFFQYPFPVVRGQTQLEIDPYHIRPYLDSFDASRKLDGFGYYNTSLNFASARKTYTHIILSSLQTHHDTIFLLVSNRNPDKTDLVFCDLKTGKQLIKTVDLPFRNCNYLMANHMIHALIIDNEDHRLMTYSIQSLLRKE